MTTHQDTSTERDLVERMRSHSWVPLLVEAADEIERLRAALASRDEAAQQSQGQAVSDAVIEKLALRTCWKYRYSTDPYHSSNYRFDRTTLLQFARAILSLRDKPATAPDGTPNNAV